MMQQASSNRQHSSTPSPIVITPQSNEHDIYEPSRNSSEYDNPEKSIAQSSGLGSSGIPLQDTQPYGGNVTLNCQEQNILQQPKQSTLPHQEQHTTHQLVTQSGVYLPRQMAMDHHGQLASNQPVAQSGIHSGQPSIQQPDTMQEQEKFAINHYGIQHDRKPPMFQQAQLATNQPGMQPPIQPPIQHPGQSAARQSSQTAVLPQSKQSSEIPSDHLQAYDDILRISQAHYTHCQLTEDRAHQLIRRPVSLVCIFPNLISTFSFHIHSLIF